MIWGRGAVQLCSQRSGLSVRGDLPQGRASLPLARSLRARAMNSEVM